VLRLDPNPRRGELNPFDVAETGEAIKTALEMEQDEKVRRARGLVRTVLASNPARWLTSQLRDLDLARGIQLERTQQHEEPFGALDGHVGAPAELIGSLEAEDRDPADDRV